VPAGARPARDPRLLAVAVRRGDVRALARAVSWLEAGDARGATVLAEIRRGAAAAEAASPEAGRLVGVTGPPGSGKSTLVDRLVERYRARGRTVAVVAVDPTSPYSGGALLGDRIRMTRWHADPGVFVRSMATRGQLGGLAAATLRVAELLAEAGYARVLIETVGVGQSEVDVADVADTTLLVLTPGAGDAVQAVKAGVLEVADVVAINKDDLPGAERLRREILAAQALADAPAEGWRPPVTTTRSHDGHGVEELLEAIEAHHAWLADQGRAEARERRMRAELAAAVQLRAREALRRHAGRVLPALAEGRTTAERAAAQVLRRLGGASAGAGDAAQDDVDASSGPAGSHAPDAPDTSDATDATDGSDERDAPPR
jgi:LAO/AO transport system kinase